MPLDLDEIYRILRTDHLQAQGVINTIAYPLLVLDSALTVVDANLAFYKTFDTSSDETVDHSFHDLGNGQWNIEELRILIEKIIPNTSSVSDYEVTAKFPVIGLRTMLLSARRIEQSGSGRRLLLLSMVDATQRHRETRKSDILIGELTHRLSNLLTVTQSLVRQTKIQNRTAEEYRDDLLGRLTALGNSLKLTLAKDKAELPALVREVLEPYIGDGGPVMLEKGPTVSLSTSQSMGLGMMLHELATNAVKYGALSVPDGRVSIVWKIENEGEKPSSVKLRWRESNGPSVTAPAANGFGTRLIEFTAAQDLGGQVVQDYQPDGLIVTLTFPHA